MAEFEVGKMIRVLGEPNHVGEIYAARPGRITGRMMYSVKFEVEGKNRSHGFYYAEEIAIVEEDS